MQTPPYPYPYSQAEDFLTPEAFARDWAGPFSEVFLPQPGAADERRWIPAQVFQPGFTFELFNTFQVLTPGDYEKLQRALLALGESKFAVVGLGTLRGYRTLHHERLSWPQHTGYNRVRPVGASFEAYTFGNPVYDVDFQPTEFYLVGESGRWGIAGSEKYNLGIVGYRNEAVRPFSQAGFAAPEAEFERYLTTAPLEWVETLNRNYQPATAP